MEIHNGDLIKFIGKDERLWVALHHSKINMQCREKYRKHVKNHTGFYLFGGLWYEGDALTDKPYGKCKEQLERSMFAQIEIVGNITTHAELFKQND